jgi:hypothetical protein
MHSPNKLNELRMRRKKPPLSTRPANLKRQFHEKIEWGILPWLRESKTNNV